VWHHCHLGICQVAPVQTFWLLARNLSGWWKNSASLTDKLRKCVTHSAHDIFPSDSL
jgi:hypothetical protein